MKLVGVKQSGNDLPVTWQVSAVKYTVVVNESNVAVAIIDVVGDITQILTAADKNFQSRASVIKQAHGLDFVIPQNAKVVP